MAANRPVLKTAFTNCNNALPIIALDWDAGQQVAVGVASAASAVFDAISDRVVEASATTDCWITIGNAPVAAAAAKSTSLLKGFVHYLYVPAGMKVAVIENSADGFLSLIPATLGG